jgi:AcrR family transcriptional regulator
MPASYRQGELRDEAHRAALLERVVDYVLEHGLADLSLRPLAAAVGSSPRILLYYFASKEALVTEILSTARIRQQRRFEQLRLSPDADSLDTCRAIWSAMSDARFESIYRLFFEVYGMALQRPKKFPDFLRGVVHDWLAFIEAPKVRAGVRRADARRFATVVLAGFRGFLLDLCTTRERSRVNQAVALWLRAIHAIPDKELSVVR